MSFRTQLALGTIVLLLGAVLVPWSLFAQGTARSFQFVADGGIVGAPRVDDDGTVYCATDGGSLVSLDSQGQLLWRRDLGGRGRIFLPLEDGSLISLVSGGGIETYNPTGERIASAPLPRENELPQAAFETPEGWILLCYADGELITSTFWGRGLQTWRLPGPGACPPAVFEDHLAWGSSEGEVVIFSLSGRRKRSLESEVPAASLAWTRGGLLALSREDGGFALVSPWEGILWEQRLSFAASAIYPLGEESFVLAGKGGGLFLLKNGEVLVLEGREKRLTQGLLGKGGLFFALYETGGLQAYDGEGQSLWSFALKASSGRPSLSQNGRFLALGGDDWVIHLFEFVRVQGDGDGGEVPPSRETKKGADSAEEYRDDPDYHYLLSEASTPWAPRKEGVLKELEKRFQDWDFGRSLPYVMPVLRLLAEEPHIRLGAPDYPPLRFRAIHLLSNLGSHQNMDFFADLLLREQDPLVQMGILEGMGRLGSDPRGRGARSILEFLERTPLQSWDRRGWGLVSALEGISRHHGRLSPPLAGAASLLLSTPNYTAPWWPRLGRLTERKGFSQEKHIPQP